MNKLTLLPLSGFDSLVIPLYRPLTPAPHILPTSLVAINTSQKPQSLEAFGLKGIVEEHRILTCVSYFDSVSPIEEGDIVESILE